MFYECKFFLYDGANKSNIKFWKKNKNKKKVGISLKEEKTRLINALYLWIIASCCAQIFQYRINELIDLQIRRRRGFLCNSRKKWTEKKYNNKVNSIYLNFCSIYFLAMKLLCTVSKKKCIFLWVSFSFGPIWVVL